MSCNLNLWCVCFNIDYFSSALSQISLNLTSLNKNVLLLVLTSWVKNNVVSSNSWNYSWISHSWHGTVLLYKLLNRYERYEPVAQQGCCAVFFFLTFSLFQVRLSRAFLISLKYLLTIIKQIFLFNTMLSLQYFHVLEYEHSHLQYSIVCNITFRMSKRRFTCARTVSTWKVPATVPSSIVLVWLKKDTKTNSVWIFFLYCQQYSRKKRLKIKFKH